VGDTAASADTSVDAEFVAVEVDVSAEGVTAIDGVCADSSTASSPSAVVSAAAPAVSGSIVLSSEAIASGVTRVSETTVPKSGTPTNEVSAIVDVVSMAETPSSSARATRDENMDREMGLFI